MGRILAIDYGRKRSGIAVTDILKISANGLPTIPSARLESFLLQYVAKEDVEEIVIGHPRRIDGEESENMRYIKPFLQRLAKILPEMRITLFDERFTSVIAHQAMIAGGVPKMARREKGLADRTAAIIILTDYLQSRTRVV